MELINLHAPSLTTKWNKNAMYPLVFTMRGLSSGSGGPVLRTDSLGTCKTLIEDLEGKELRREQFGR